MSVKTKTLMAAMAAISQPIPFDGDGDGDGGDKIVLTKEEFEAKITEASEKAVGGLKSKNAELLDGMAKLKENLSKFEGVDPEAFRKMTEYFDQHEEAELLKDGKMEEVIKRRTQRELATYDSKMKEVGSKLEEAQTQADFFRTRFQQKMIDDTLRSEAMKAGIRPEALDDVILNGRSTFSLSEDEQVEAVDKDGNLIKYEDEVMTPEVYIRKLRKDKPHYWPSSKGGGASGGGDDFDADSLEAQINKAAAEGNMSKYRELRKKQAQGG
ncbi:hypothetical protein [Zhongshania sp.]|uniref:hypothetical protein n=1 Tax=Zhongshania sp. TaxID=1971902 RepID=UPI003563EEF5